MQLLSIEIKEGKKHLVRFFPTVNDSIESYFKNINTHFAYKDFRKKRKMLRIKKLPLNPIILVKHLNVYAEDQNYVENIKSIIRVNKLTQFDSLKNITTNS